MIIDNYANYKLVFTGKELKEVEFLLRKSQEDDDNLSGFIPDIMKKINEAKEEK